MSGTLHKASRAVLRTQMSARVLLTLMLAMLAYAGTPSLLYAEETREATTSDDARRQAVESIPLGKIDKAHRTLVRKVITSPSVFRRLPTNVVDCDPRLFTYFSTNPDVLVAIWKQMGLSRVELTRTGSNTFKLSDGAGTTGDLRIVEQACNADAQNRIVMYAEGSYDGKPFTKPITAQCVIVLQSGSVVETNGRTYVASRLDSFVKLDRPTMEILAKAAHPFIGKTADRNFSDTLSFVSNFSYTAERRPSAIDRLASELDQIDASRRDQLSKLAHTIGASAEVAEVSQASGNIVEISPR